MKLQHLRADDSDRTPKKNILTREMKETILPLLERLKPKQLFTHLADTFDVEVLPTVQQLKYFKANTLRARRKKLKIAYLLAF